MVLKKPGCVLLRETDVMTSLPVGKHTVQRHDIRVTSGVMTVTSGRETHRTTTRY